VALCTLGSGVFAQPSANDVLHAARQALGGGKLAAIERLSVSGEATNGPVLSDLTLSIQLPDKFLREQSLALLNGAFPGMPAEGVSPQVTAALGRPTAVDCLNGDQQWSDLRMSADAQIDSGLVQRAAGAQLNARRQDLRRTFTRYLLALLLTDRPAFRIEFSYAGQTATPDGGTADILDGKGPGDFGLRLFIDSKSHHPLMMVYPAGDNFTELWMAKYKEESGVLMPHLLSWMQNGHETERFEIKKVRLNPKFPSNKFVKQ
jgi:hypothetical protein